MSHDTTDSLTRLLITFDAQRLGEGDVFAGANVIAAMACAIANVHRHGTRIKSGDAPAFRIGSSVLAYGPLTSALIGERVESVLAEFQSNLDSHCNEWELAKNAYLGGLNGRPPDERFIVKATSKSLCFINEASTGGIGNLAQLLAPMPNRMKRALLERPLIYTSGAQPKQLGAALERSHAGQLLVHDVLRTPSQCADLADCCMPLIDGCLMVGKQARPVRGHLMLCDPSQVLEEVLRENNPAKRLMLRLPWLVDGSAGPSLPVPKASADRATQLDRIEDRFQGALAKAWLKRLDYSALGPETLGVDFSACQARWVAFLQQKEADFPGISAAARPLLATLLFGLHEMFVSLPKSDDVEFYVDGAEALARILVQRMCNARAVIQYDASKETKERKLRTMFEKLSAGPASARDLTRMHHRLPTNEARDLLSELVARRQAVELGGDRYQVAITTA
jgi:hypothetical protein